jgi:hypothetical protein
MSVRQFCPVSNIMPSGRTRPASGRCCPHTMRTNLCNSMRTLRRMAGSRWNSPTSSRPVRQCKPTDAHGGTENGGINRATPDGPRRIWPNWQALSGACGTDQRLLPSCLHRRSEDRGSDRQRRRPLASLSERRRATPCPSVPPVLARRPSRPSPAGRPSVRP